MLNMKTPLRTCPKKRNHKRERIRFGRVKFKMQRTYFTDRKKFPELYKWIRRSTKSIFLISGKTRWTTLFSNTKIRRKKKVNLIAESQTESRTKET